MLFNILFQQILIPIYAFILNSESNISKNTYRTCVQKLIPQENCGRIIRNCISVVKVSRLIFEENNVVLSSHPGRSRSNVAISNLRKEQARRMLNNI
jgi:hypothetical protein